MTEQDKRLASLALLVVWSVFLAVCQIAVVLVTIEKVVLPTHMWWLGERFLLAESVVRALAWTFYAATVAAAYISCQPSIHDLTRYALESDR